MAIVELFAVCNWSFDKLISLKIDLFGVPLNICNLTQPNLTTLYDYTNGSFT